MINNLRHAFYVQLQGRYFSNEYLAAFLNPLYDFTGFLREKIPQGAFRDKLRISSSLPSCIFRRTVEALITPDAAVLLGIIRHSTPDQRQFGGHNFVIYPCYLAGRFFPDITHRDIKRFGNLAEYSSI